MSLAQIKNTGDLEATEFSEISYAGKGDGASVYINTNILPRDIYYWKIRKTYNDGVNTYESHGCSQTVTGGACYLRMITYRADGIGLERMYCGLSTYKRLSGLVENQVYDYEMTIVPNGVNWDCLCSIKDMNGTVIDSDIISSFSKTALDLIPAPVYICSNNTSGTSAYPTYNKIYSFTINSETWYINNGTGNTITGSLGTVLTVNGTLTNFWQISDIWNEDANLKMYNTGLVKCNEFIEDDTITEQMKIYSDSVKIKNQFIEV